MSKSQYAIILSWMAFGVFFSEVAIPMHWLSDMECILIGTPATLVGILAFLVIDHRKNRRRYNPPMRTYGTYGPSYFSSVAILGEMLPKLREKLGSLRYSFPVDDTRRRRSKSTAKCVVYGLEIELDAAGTGGDSQIKPRIVISYADPYPYEFEIARVEVDYHYTGYWTGGVRVTGALGYIRPPHEFSSADSALAHIVENLTRAARRGSSGFGLASPPP